MVRVEAADDLAVADQLDLCAGGPCVYRGGEFRGGFHHVADLVLAGAEEEERAAGDEVATGFHGGGDTVDADGAVDAGVVADGPGDRAAGLSNVASDEAVAVMR